MASSCTPKMGKSHFDNQRLFELEQEMYILEEKLVELKKKS